MKKLDNFDVSIDQWNPKLELRGMRGTLIRFCELISPPFKSLPKFQTVKGI